MAIVIRFSSPGFTAAKYDECVKKLQEAGAGSPAGRLFHVCFGSPENLLISDIWDSRESFAKFGEALKPILAELGIDAGEPEIFEVYNTIEAPKAVSAIP